MASYSEIFNLNFKILYFLGLWTLETDNFLKKKLYYLYQQTSLFIIMVFGVQQYIDLYIFRHDMEKFTFNFCLVTLVTLIFFKSLRLTQFISGVSALREKLNENAEEENDDECKKILSKAAFEIKILNILVHSSGCFICGLICVSPLLDKSGTRNLAIRQWFPFDIQVSPNYEFASLYQVLLIFPIAIIELEIDLSVFGFIISLSAEYEILKRRLEEFTEIYKETEDGDYKMNQNVQDAKTFEIFRDAVIQHQQITERVRLFNDIYNRMMLYNVIASAALLVSATVDVLVMSTEINGRVIGEFLYIAIASGLGFITCFYGTRLHAKGYEIGFGMYNTPWFLMRPRFRKYLIIIMIQAERTPVLTVGGLMNVDVVAFSLVMNKSYEWMTVFSTLAANSQGGNK